VTEIITGMRQLCDTLHDARDVNRTIFSTQVFRFHLASCSKCEVTSLTKFGSYENSCYSSVECRRECRSSYFEEWCVTITCSLESLSAAKQTPKPHVCADCYGNYHTVKILCDVL